VEFGVKDGNECCTRYLRERHKWTGLLMDGSHENPGINLHKEFITADNIGELFRKYQVPNEFDLLVIDIDGNDIYVWYKLCQPDNKDAYRPRVVTIEYNARFPPNDDRMISYESDFVWRERSEYFGASLSALHKIGVHLGYRLVYCEKMGVNAFFVRNDLADKYFPKNGSIDAIYKPPRYNHRRGWFELDQVDSTIGDNLRKLKAN